MIMRASKSDICRADPGKSSYCRLQPKEIEILPLLKTHSFGLRLSTDWKRPSYTMESALLYSKSAYLNAITSKKE